MQNRNKHHYTIDEHILPGKIRVMYVKHRSLHSWGFIVLTLLWLLFSISLFCLIWNEASKLLFGTSCILFFLYCFIILVLSSFILVYCPSYIKRIICKTPFVAHTEGKRVKRRLADLMIYIYDAGAVEFLLNVAYVVFFCLICIRKFQYSDSLFSKEIDEVILNAFIVFLSFEGVRSSYKRIHISAKLFFQKILNLLDT